jgi:peroxiredoxin
MPVSRLLAFCAFAVVAALNLAAQDQNATASQIPDVHVKNLEGVTVNTADWRDDSILVISFWATWCKPCLVELQTYSELYADWQARTGVRVVAVSIDDSRNARKVPAFVKGRNWPFDVVLDENADLKRAMNVNNVPHTFIVQNGHVVWQHSAFAPGDEEDVEAEILKLKAATN